MLAAVLMLCLCGVGSIRAQATKETAVSRDSSENTMRDETRYPDSSAQAAKEDAPQKAPAVNQRKRKKHKQRPAAPEPEAPQNEIEYRG